MTTTKLGRLVLAVILLEHICARCADSGEPVLRLPGTIDEAPIKYSESYVAEPAEAKLVNGHTGVRVLYPSHSNNNLRIETTRGDSAAVTNAEVLKKIDSPVPVEASISYSRATGEATVTQVRADSVSSWGRLRDGLKLSKATVSQIDRAVDAVDKATRPAIGGNVAAGNTRDIHETYDVLRKELVRGYREASDIDEKRQVAKILTGVIREQNAWSATSISQSPSGTVFPQPGSPTPASDSQQQKATTYTTERSVFTPRSYENIYQASRATVGITNGDNELPFASGALIGTNLVLTCAHQVIRPGLDGTPNPSTDDLRVLFYYELAGDQPSLYCRVTDVVFGGTVEPSTGTELDFALLEIENLQDSPKLPAPIKITKSAVARSTRFFLVGHPEGKPMSVTDLAKVLYPYEASPDVVTEMEADITANIDDARERSALTKSFDAAYLPVAAGNRPTELFRYYSGGMPSLGAICTTSHGNSGGPAILRESDLLFGILVTGMPDAPAPYQPGWNAHETLLPIKAIVEQIDQASGSDSAPEKIKNWRTKYHVQVKP